MKKMLLEIAKIHVKAWQVGYKEFMPKEYLESLSIESKKTIWSEALTKKGLGTNLVIVVIEENGFIVGFSNKCLQLTAKIHRTPCDTCTILGNILSLYGEPFSGISIYGVGNDILPAQKILAIVAGIAWFFSFNWLRKTIITGYGFLAFFSIFMFYKVENRI